MDTLTENIELLQRLRKEIDRLGISESPSKTDYDKNRDKKLSPPSTTVMARTDLTWSQIMQLIGVRYDGQVLLKDREYTSDDFPDMTQDEKIDYFAEKVRHIGLTLNGWYRVLNIVDEGAMANKSSASKRDKYVDPGFKEMDKGEQLGYLLKYIDENKITNTTEYNKRRDKEKTPSMTFIVTNLGGWKNIRSEYKLKYGRELG